MEASSNDIGFAILAEAIAPSEWIKYDAATRRMKEEKGNEQKEEKSATSIGDILDRKTRELRMLFFNEWRRYRTSDLHQIEKVMGVIKTLRDFDALRNVNRELTSMLLDLPSMDSVS